MSFTAKIEGSELVIRAQLNSPPERSASGKTLVLASSHGNVQTTAEYDGQLVTIGFNAYYKPAR